MDSVSYRRSGVSYWGRGSISVSVSRSSISVSVSRRSISVVSIGSGCSIGSMSIGRRYIVIGTSDVEFTDAGIRSVNGLGVSGDLSEVSGSAEDVALLAHKSRGCNSVGVRAGSVCAGGIGASIADGCGCAEVTSVGGSQEGGEDDEL